MRRYLADNGFRVTVASGSKEARDQLNSMVFDLIVMDVMMPGESGLSLTDSLRKRSTVPILMLTAMGETEDRIHIMFDQQHGRFALKGSQKFSHAF